MPMNDPPPTTSNEISWPIILAVVPTLGTFIAGSAEIWNDFVLIVLILYYVFKWMTVPWSYYESARSRRLIHFHATREMPSKQNQLASELRRHEVTGLLWVIASPFIAGYTLQYSRYFLSDYDRYMSSFNVAVFVLAASLKPLSHVMMLLRERTLFLQSEIQVNDTHVVRLQKRIDILEEELFALSQAYATKKDLGQMADGLSPTLQQLSKSMRRFEKKEQLLRSWSEDRFTLLDDKLREFDDYICYKIEQEQRLNKSSTITTLILLPLNITVWVAKTMTGLLPSPTRALLSGPLDDVPLPSLMKTKSLSHRPSTASLKSRSSHFASSDLLSCPSTPDPATI
ncbi:hypothetical protein DM01DRAFT_322416 [Hesseltinella vesiculosa]|uniref:Uncharacterized protein n=1 Tax=Hesseltinella vesiculosa TaxID=101127 RepID=A0A1X2GM87_9FUNG|nr:hypothetical protein DM01DRAFT_322416 [Hesseltinella vesiculosa]